MPDLANKLTSRLANKANVEDDTAIRGTITIVSSACSSLVKIKTRYRNEIIT